MSAFIENVKRVITKRFNLLSAAVPLLFSRFTKFTMHYSKINIIIYLHHHTLKFLINTVFKNTG